MSIEDLLEVLGNPTRLKILRSLADGPKYLLELARELDLSEPAILKHLIILERYGLISSFKRDSKTGPPRKYYYLKTGFTVDVGFTDGLFDISVRRLEEPICEEVESIAEELQRVKRIKNCVEAVEKVATLSELIDRELSKLRRKEASLLALKSEIYRYLGELLETFCETYLERKIAEWMILSQSRERLLDEVKTALNISDTEFKLIVEKLRSKIPYIDRFTI
jgi:ArsR family transcriptional regulator